MVANKILFTLNNTGIHHDYTGMAFTSFEILLTNPASNVHRFVKDLGYFSVDEFLLLHHRISIEAQPEIKMNLKHVVIFYAVVHFVCKSYLDSEEEPHLLKTMGEDEKGFVEIRDKFLSYGKVVTDLLKKIKDDKFKSAIKVIVKH